MNKLFNIDEKQTQEITNKVIKIVQAFEDHQLNPTQAIQQIYSLTGKEIDIHYLHNYWSSTDLKDFARSLAMQPITDWQDINDEKTLKLLHLIIPTLNKNWDNAINAVYMEAIEKKYRKPSGFLSDLIYHDDLTPEQILNKLNENNVTYL